METKTSPMYMLSTTNPLWTSDTVRLKIRGWKIIFHANGKQNKAGVAIIVSDKIDLKIKNITRDKEGYYIMIKGSIQEEDISIVNIYAPNIGQRLVTLYRRQGSRPSPRKRNAKKAKWLSEEALQIVVKRREAKNKGKKERYTHLNAEFQRIARRDKKGHYIMIKGSVQEEAI